MRLRGKIALVTGGGSGIGRQTAIVFAAGGASVIVADRYADDAAATAEMIKAEVGDSASILTAQNDIARESEIEELARTCADGFGRVDVVVNNAGIRDYGQVTETEQSRWDDIYAVNLRGAALVSKHFIPLMRPGSAIVIVSSVHAIAGRPGMILYDSMKAGLLGMTRSMACDHAADGIRVNAVLPGRTLTEYHIKRAAETGEKLDESVTEVPYDGGPGLLKRQAKAREIAYANLFLASDEASYITGVALPVDGGVTAYCPS